MHSPKLSVPLSELDRCNSHSEAIELSLGLSPSLSTISDHKKKKEKRKNYDGAESRKIRYIFFVWLMSPPWSSFLNSYIKIKTVYIYGILRDVVIQVHIVDIEVGLGQTCLFLQVFRFCIIKAFKILSPNLDAYTLPLYQLF